MSEEQHNGAPPPKRAPRPKATAAPKADQTGDAPQGAKPAPSPLPSTNEAGDDTYIELRQAERVVMRHQIALNLDNFRAAPDGFVARPNRVYPALQATVPPFASVIVPNKDGMRFLPALLNALKAQTFNDFEVIVVDDASRDSSVSWIETNHPWVRLLVHRHNEGFVAACNEGADAARGHILIFLNNDTEPEPEWLAEVAKAVCSRPDVGIFASKILLHGDKTKLHAAGDQLGVDGIPRNRGVWQTDVGQYDASTTVFSGSGGAVAYRRALWDALGGFDADFWMYLEDIDFAFRAQLMGWQALYVPTARVYHHLTATAGGTLASYYVGRNTIWTLVKNMPTALLLRNLGWIAAAQLGIAADALANIRGKAARARLMGQVAGIAGAPRQFWKRRLIQARRRLTDAELATRLTRQDA